MSRFLQMIRNEELVYSIVIKLVQMAGGLIIIKLLSTYLSKNEFGNYSLMMATLGLISMIPFSALNQGTLRFTAEYNTKVSFFFSNMLVIYLFFIFSYCLVIIFLALVYNFSEQWRILIIILPFLVFSTVLFGFLTWFENALKHQKYFALMLFLDLAIKVSGITALEYYEYLHTESVFILFIFSSISIFLIFADDLFEVNLISLVKAKKIFSEMLPYIYPILIWSIFIWAQGMVYRWYLGIYTSTSEVASFSIMSSLAILPATSITGILGTYLLPKLFHQKGTSQQNTLSYIVKIVFVVVILLSIIWGIIALFNREIVILLTDSKYANESWMLPYMFLSMIIYAIGNILAYVIFVQKETKDLLVSNILPGLFAITVGFFLIKDYGLNGALFSFMATYSLSGLLNSYAVIRNNKGVF